MSQSEHWETLSDADVIQKKRVHEVIKSFVVSAIVPFHTVIVKAASFILNVCLIYECVNYARLLFYGLFNDAVSSLFYIASTIYASDAKRVIILVCEFDPFTTS